MVALLVMAHAVKAPFYNMLPDGNVDPLSLHAGLIRRSAMPMAYLLWLCMQCTGTRFHHLPNILPRPLQSCSSRKAVSSCVPSAVFITNTRAYQSSLPLTLAHTKLIKMFRIMKSTPALQMLSRT